MIRYFLLILLIWCFTISDVQSQHVAQLSEENKLTKATQEILVKLPHLSGESLQFSNFNNNVVVITFFASWCPPCRVELKHLDQLYRKHHTKGLKVIAINYFEDFDDFSNDQKLMKFLKKMQLEFPAIKGDEAISAKFGNITRIPSLFIFNRQGHLVFKSVTGGSSISMENLEGIITPLLVNNIPETNIKKQFDQLQSDYWDTPIPLQGTPPENFHLLAKGISVKDCANCHVDKFQEWSESLHSETMGNGVLGQYPHFDASSIAQCNTCHAPMSEQWQYLPQGNSWAENSKFDQSLLKEGLSCAACHLRNHQRNAPPLKEGKISLSAALHGAAVRSSYFEDSKFCAKCHQHQEGPQPGGKFVENTYQEWLQSPAFKKGQTCQSCHMPDRKHLWKGIHDKQMTLSGVSVSYTTNLENPKIGDVINTSLTIQNTETGHMFPTYTTPAIFVKTALLDINGRAIPGFYEEKIIQRRLNMSTYPWTEYFDTRIAPDESVTLKFDRKIPSNAKSLKLWIWVEPDHFYEGFYRSILKNSPNHRGYKQLSQALQTTLDRQYALFSKTIQIQ